MLAGAVTRTFGFVLIVNLRFELMVLNIGQIILTNLFFYPMRGHSTPNGAKCKTEHRDIIRTNSCEQKTGEISLGFVHLTGL